MVKIIDPAAYEIPKAVADERRWRKQEREAGKRVILSDPTPKKPKKARAVKKPDLIQPGPSRPNPSKDNQKKTAPPQKESDRPPLYMAKFAPGYRIPKNTKEANNNTAQAAGGSRPTVT